MPGKHLNLGCLSNFTKKLIFLGTILLMSTQAYALSASGPGEEPQVEPTNYFQQGADYYRMGQYRLALEKFYLSAMAGNSEAAIQAGLMHDFGRGVPRNFIEAGRWYNQAAQLGSRKAIFLLGHMEEFGEGRQVSLAKAFRWYSAAATLGESNAQFSLGQFYLEGKFVRPDYDKAVYWLKLAADQRNPAAMDMLQRIREHKQGG